MPDPLATFNEAVKRYLTEGETSFDELQTLAATIPHDSASFFPEFLATLQIYRGLRAVLRRNMETAAKLIEPAVNALVATTGTTGAQKQDIAGYVNSCLTNLGLAIEIRTAGGKRLARLKVDARDAEGVGKWGFQYKDGEEWKQTWLKVGVAISQPLKIVPAPLADPDAPSFPTETIPSPE